ncbi:unnamed protein product [Ectocarpus sp. CCAP 1310/34]|nr:unnamed protein product [Ectocarpus sp. CCAP 1310/34]
MRPPPSLPPPEDEEGTVQRHYKRLGVPSENEAFDQVFKNNVDARAQKEEETPKADVWNVELEKEFTEDEVEACVNKLKCHKAAGADGIVNECMKWREGVVVNLFKKGDKTDPGNCRGITLLTTVGKVFCKLLNDRIVGVLEKEHSISEGQAGFRKKRGCVDHVFTVGRIIQGRKRAGKPTYCFFLDVKKAYDTMDQDTYLGAEIANDCWWNAHVSKVAARGKARAGKLHPILANRHLDTRIKLTVLKSVIVPPLEYAGELKAAKIILGCSKHTSIAAARAELGIQSLRSGRDARKLTWQYRMCGMGEERLPRIVWEAKWANKKRGRQPTEWVKVVEDVWKGLDIDEDETLETEGFKEYLHGPMDAGTKLKVKFRTGDIGLRERRRRHRTVDNEDDEFKCDCGFECEDRVHVVAECP